MMTIGDYFNEDIPGKAILRIAKNTGLAFIPEKTPSENVCCINNPEVRNDYKAAFNNLYIRNYFYAVFNSSIYRKNLRKLLTPEL